MIVPCARFSATPPGSLLKREAEKGTMPLFAALAQSVEQLFCKEKVPSSSLGGGSRKIYFFVVVAVDVAVFSVSSCGMFFLISSIDRKP